MSACPPRVGAQCDTQNWAFLVLWCVDGVKGSYAGSRGFEGQVPQDPVGPRLDPRMRSGGGRGTTPDPGGGVARSQVYLGRPAT